MSNVNVSDNYDSSQSLSDSELESSQLSEVIYPQRMSSARSQVSSGCTEDVQLDFATPVYVSGLTSSVTESALFNLFSTWGPVRSTKICRDLAGNCLGCGYVNFKEKAASTAAISHSWAGQHQWQADINNSRGQTRSGAMQYLRAKSES